MHLKYFFIVFFILILLGAGCQNNDALPKDLQIDYEEDVKPLIADNNKSSVRGSCNVISEKSTCLDYRGSMWGENDMKLNCKDVGIWSKNSCPYSDIGGCLTGQGTITETVIWHYNKGANAVTPADAVYAAKACNANPAGKWVMPEQVDFQKK